MIKISILSIFIFTILCSCQNNTVTQAQTNIVKDTLKPSQPQEESIKDSLSQETAITYQINDTLNSIASIIAGNKENHSVYSFISDSKAFLSFSKNFEKRWIGFDSSRIQKLNKFREEVIAKEVKSQKTLFYPFSGPDILYAYTFFPDVEKYVMIGLEPVGSLPEFKKEEKDSLNDYFNKINTSLNAILKYSFFRTESMSKDLKNEEVNGTVHLLFLFLNRTGNSICSAKPVTVDSLGKIKYIHSFEALKKLKTATRGIEIQFVTKDHQLKTLYYFSLNAANGGLKYNKGFYTYLQNMGTINTYLKGASYLMHKDYFSMIRNVILKQSQYVIQDDSGIAFHYFTESGRNWNYHFYGKYLKPIPMFSQFYQKDLDSLYQEKGSKDIGFGIGYNFKDKNSNFMIAEGK